MTDADFMAEYPKIHTLWKRDKKGRIMHGEFARPEFEYLWDAEWLWTEKVDGTNIRLGWEPDGSFDGNEVAWIRGRTDDAQIPPFLLERLIELQRSMPYGDVFDGPVTLYGEGYGARIQKGGGNYNPDGVDFVLFDVKVGPWWLDLADVQDVARKLGIDVVAAVSRGGIAKAEALVTEDGFTSSWQRSGRDTFRPEGLVGRPAVTLFNKAGERVLCKIKHKDYQRLAPIDPVTLEYADR